MRISFVLVLTLAVILGQCPHVFGQNGDEGLGHPPRPDLDRSTGTAPGISRVGQDGIGNADNNPGRDSAVGGIPCSFGDQCALGIPSGGGASAGEGQVGAPPAPPPPPPTHAEIVATVCPPPPRPAVGYNPREYGITGLHTWLWSEGPHLALASGSIRGYPITCTIEAAIFTFDTGDPHAERYGHEQTYTTADPGREHEDTEVQHMWEVKGAYAIRLDILWSRSTTAGSDTTTTTISRPLQVKEIVSGMTAPSS